MIVKGMIAAFGVEAATSLGGARWVALAAAIMRALS